MPMPSIVRTLAALGATVVLGALLAGCTPNAAFRTQTTPCAESLPGAEAKDCARVSSVEQTGKYTLGFMEFDDQGWMHDQGQAQMERIFKLLDAEAAKPDQNLLLLVFVHGWKHNADHDDGNVAAFRATLEHMYDLDAGKVQIQAREKGVRELPRKVIGIYASWRGLAMADLGPLENLSFYTRKGAADRVAKGSIRELFARLRRFQQAKFQHNPTDPKVRMIVLGHSFGGLVVYTALSQFLMESAVALDEQDASKTPVRPFADMVVLINPAFEGSRYEPLHHIAKGRRYPPGQPPVFVVVTTANDYATRYAFPTGRWINTLLERERTGPQKEANRHTLGHIERLRTHTLTPCDGQDLRPPAGGGAAPCDCPGWKGNLHAGITDDDVAIEEDKARQFRRQWEATPGGALRPGWTRYFCGGVKLMHEPGHESRDPDTPFWNVYTDARIVDGHNGFYDRDGFDASMFRHFIRQLFHDTWPK
ncbi:MAG: hypothetical protein HY778_10930 [Betaproteobacteria bacterium]|nr:hypothetical protein [Betaproteobacteria bacterium]